MKNAKNKGQSHEGQSINSEQLQHLEELIWNKNTCTMSTLENFLWHSETLRINHVNKLVSHC